MGRDALGGVLFPTPETTDPPSWSLEDVVVVSRNEAWIVGWRSAEAPHHRLDVVRPMVARWNGWRWRIVPIGMWKVHGYLDAIVEEPQTGRLVAVGSRVSRAADGRTVSETLILRWNGTAWHRMPSPTPGVGSGYGDLVTAGSQLWAVGWTKPRGEMYRLLASRLSTTGWTVRLGPYGDWREADAAGVSAHEIWAVGSAGGGRHEGLVARWNGHGWGMDRRLERVDRLTGVVAPTSGDVWAVGYTFGQEPRILHRPGGVWRVDWARHTWGNLHAIGGTPHNLWTFLSYPVQGGNEDDPALAFTSLHRC